MERLPEDLKMEILLHLPVKSILRCKCLSKSWFSLISNPDFTNLHLQRSSSSQHTHRFLYTSPSQMWSIDINASFHDDSATIKLDFPPLIKPNTDVEIISSCRGFVLLALMKEQQLFLWNPSTSHHKQIPNPPLPSLSSISYGFCYDESTDDYLLLAHNYKDPSGLKSFEIFSLRTNSWQKLSLNHQLPNMTSIPFQVKSGCFLNGAIHWLILGCDPPQPNLHATKIIAFDITTKYVREIGTPADDDDDHINYGLGVLGGCLALTRYHHMYDNCEIEIWMMKEYGVESSWTKFISLSCRRSGIYYIFPLCFTKDGEILATDGGVGLSKWSDDEGELLEYLEFCGRPRKPGIVYTETLLSLPF